MKRALVSLVIAATAATTGYATATLKDVHDPAGNQRYACTALGSEDGRLKDCTDHTFLDFRVGKQGPGWYHCTVAIWGNRCLNTR